MSDSDNKEVKKITTKQDDKDNNEAITKVLEDMTSYKYCKTDILHKVNFMSDMDKFVFDSLPLTNSQKEELLLSLYPITE
jgi:hypothetical protein